MNTSSPALVASRLEISEEAAQLSADCELIDLHIDTFIPHRLWGYDPFSRHKSALLGRHLFGHLDHPRCEDGGMTGALWSITTNPFRLKGSRWRVFQRNLVKLQGLIRDSNGRAGLVTNRREYDAVRATGAHAAMICIQGGNAIEAAPEGVASIADDAVIRITLVHLTNSSLGTTNSPHHLVRGSKGLTSMGKTFVEQCNDRRVFVDLAHIHPRGFWDAVEAHNSDQPLIVTHTGVNGVRPHWRNIDDAQIKAVADTGGVVGVIFAGMFLSRKGGPTDGAMVVEHLEHIIDVGGEEVAAIGSDFDGAITPPHELRGGETYPVLVHHMLARGWSHDRIRRVFATNFLDSFGRLRP